MQTRLSTLVEDAFYEGVQTERDYRSIHDKMPDFDTSEAKPSAALIEEAIMHLRKMTANCESEFPHADQVANGTVKVQPSARYALADAAQAHRDLEARRTTGSLILLP